MMRSRLLALTAALFALALPGQAQEGHPLKGSWIGEWQGNTVHDEFVVVVLDWDGESITGLINPGTDNIDITSAELDPETWTVRIEADTEDSEGRAVDYLIEGTIEDLELPNRYITGTWRNGGNRGNFEIRRQ